MPDGVLGQAAHLTGRAYIFSHRVARIAINYKTSVGYVLGKVIAHEVGHLVLPEHGHSKTGIMSALMDPRRSNAGFTGVQVATIQRTLAGN